MLWWQEKFTGFLVYVIQTLKGFLFWGCSDYSWEWTKAAKTEAKVSPICFSGCQTRQCICQNKQMEEGSVRASATRNEKRKLMIWSSSGCWLSAHLASSSCVIGSQVTWNWVTSPDEGWVRQSRSSSSPSRDKKRWGWQLKSVVWPAVEAGCVLATTNRSLSDTGSGQPFLLGPNWPHIKIFSFTIDFVEWQLKWKRNKCCFLPTCANHFWACSNTIHSNSQKYVSLRRGEGNMCRDAYLSFWGQTEPWCYFKPIVKY